MSSRGSSWCVGVGAVCRPPRRRPLPCSAAAAAGLFFYITFSADFIFIFIRVGEDGASFFLLLWQIALFLSEIYCKRMLWNFLDDMRCFRGDEI